MTPKPPARTRLRDIQIHISYQDNKVGPNPRVVNHFPGRLRAHPSKPCDGLPDPQSVIFIERQKPPDMSHAFDPKRRGMIRDLLLLSAAVATMPSCLRGRKGQEASHGNLGLGEGQRETLSALADLILPRTGTPGAIDVGADDYALLMAGECFNPDQRELFKKGLDAFETAVKKSKGRSFRELDASARAVILREPQGGGLNEEASSFLKVYRGLVVRGYTESEHFLTRVRPYELVPGRFKGCVPLES